MNPYTELIGSPNYTVIGPEPATLNMREHTTAGLALWKHSGMCCWGAVGGSSCRWMNTWINGVSEHQVAEEGESSQGRHFTFYFYCVSHGPFSSAGFRRGSWRVQWEHKSANKGHFFPNLIHNVGQDEWGYSLYNYECLTPHLLQGHKCTKETGLCW